MKTLLMFTITTIKTRRTCPRLKSDAIVYRLGHTSIQFIAPTECFKEFCGYISKHDHTRKQTLPCLLNSTFEHIVHSDHCSGRRGEEKEENKKKKRTLRDKMTIVSWAEHIETGGKDVTITECLASTSADSLRQIHYTILQPHNDQRMESR